VKEENPEKRKASAAPGASRLKLTLGAHSKRSPTAEQSVKLQVLAIFTTLYLCCTVLADGLPVDKDTGQITAVYEQFVLSGSQLEEIDVLQSVTLDSLQWAKMRKIVPSCPKRFEYVFPLTYDDCTCEQSPNLIIIDRNHAAITHNEMKFMPDYGLSEAMEVYEEPIELTIDIEGHFYFRGSLISPYRLEKIIAKSSGHDISGLQKQIHVNLPFFVKEPNSRMDAKIKKAGMLAEQAGWRFYVEESD